MTDDDADTDIDAILEELEEWAPIYDALRAGNPKPFFARIEAARAAEKAQKEARSNVTETLSATGLSIEK